MKLVLRSICLTCVLTPPKIHYIKSLSITHVKQTYSLGTNICFSILYNLLSKARTVKRRLKGWNIKERYQWPNRNVPAKDGTPSPLTRTPTVSISPGEPVLTRTTVETRKTRPVHRDRGATQQTRESDGSSAIFLSVASRFQLRTCCEIWKFCGEIDRAPDSLVKTNSLHQAYSVKHAIRHLCMIIQMRVYTSLLEGRGGVILKILIWTRFFPLETILELSMDTVW